tara:strand:- start:4223 stop:4795 length:573 start_codon:yes stop_codon:yes gene_type:complete
MADGPASEFMQSGKLPYPFAWTVDVSRGSTGGGSPTQPTQRWMAQEVTIPSEVTMFDNFGQENRGGWMPGYGVIERESFLSRSFTVNFFATDDDNDPEWAMRKWLNDIANKGLAEESKLQDGTVDCILYKNGGSPRQYISAKYAFPTHCEGFTANYGSQPFIVKSVTFACRQLDTDGSQGVTAPGASFGL